MTTNQEGRQAALRDSTSTAYGVAADWHALFDDAGISAGTFNERLLAWINSELSASYSNLVSAMQAYAEDAGYDGWEDMATLVLAMNGAETLLDGETQGLAFDFTDQSALIIDTGTPANNYDSTGIVSSGSLVGPSGKLTYTSPSNKLTRQADGYYKYQAHNLCTYSEDLTTSWSGATFTVTANNTTAPDGTATADLIQMSSASGGFVNQATTVVGATYTLTFRVKQSVAGHLRIIVSNNAVTQYFGGWFNLSTGAWGTTDAATASLVSASSEADANGFYKVSITGTVTDTASKIYFYFTGSDNTITRSTTPAAWLWGFHLYRYPANTDYIKTTSAAVYSLPYTYDTSGNCEGILVEEARTNLAASSLDLSGGTNGQTTDTFGSASIDGLSNATLLVENTATSLHNFQNGSAASFSAGSTYTLSAFVKTAGRDVVMRFAQSAFADQGGTFDLTEGTVRQEWNSPTSTSIKSLGSGWYLIAVTAVCDTSTAGGWYFGLCDDDSSTENGDTYAGDGSSGIYISDLQIELGSYATSRIRTYGATATRAADNISIATSAFPYSASAFSLFAKVKSSTLSNQLAAIVDLNDDTDYQDAQGIWQGNTVPDGVGGYFLCRSLSNTTTQFTETFSDSTAATDGDAHKIIMAYEANNTIAAMDGTAGSLDTSVTAPLFPATVMQLGARSGAAAVNWTGLIQALSFVPRRQTVVEIEAKTA